MFLAWHNVLVFHIFCAAKLRPSAPYIILKGIISSKVVIFPESTRSHVSSLEFYLEVCPLLKFYHTARELLKFYQAPLLTFGRLAPPARGVLLPIEGEHEAPPEPACSSRK